jgi:hypothetical protein
MGKIAKKAYTAKRGVVVVKVAAKNKSIKLKQ